MANVFFTLPVPAVPGTSGPVVAVPGLGPDISVVIEGPAPSGGVIVIEGSQNGIDFAPLLTINLLQDPLFQTIAATLSHMRVRRISGIAPSSVTVGAEVTPLNMFAALPVPIGVGAGAPVDVSVMGADKTVLLVGDYSGDIVIEGSNDGVNFDPILTLSTGGSSYHTFLGALFRMRVRRVGLTTPTVPTVTVGGAPSIDTEADEGITLTGAETNEVGTNDSGTEQVIIEWVPDFSDFEALSTLAKLCFVGRQDTFTGTLVTNPTVRFRVGAPIPGTPGGTIIATIPITSTTPAVYGASAMIPTPSGRQLVQVTMVGGTDNNPADFFGFIRAVVAQFRTDA
jgi:hypothetical protein